MSDDKDVRISNEGQPMTDDERVLARRFFEEHVWRGAFAQPMPNPVYALVELLRDVRRQERERRGESPPPDPLFGDGSPWREAAKKAGISADESPDTVTPGAELLAVVRRHAWRHPELRDAVQDFDRRSWRPQVYESFGCPHADSDSHWYEYSNKLTQDVLQVVEDLPSDWTSRTGVGGRLQLYAEKLLDELRAARDVVDDARKFGRCEGACVTCAQMGEACGSRELNLSLKGYDMAARVRSSDSSCDPKGGV